MAISARGGCETVKLEGKQNRMSRMRLAPARRIKGLITLPGDKSMSHRAALIGALKLFDGAGLRVDFGVSATTRGFR
jgi:hypothetical protein